MSIPCALMRGCLPPPPCGGMLPEVAVVPVLFAGVAVGACFLLANAVLLANALLANAFANKLLAIMVEASFAAAT